MKVLYIGHYADNTGWGNACINNILAMDAAGIDVVPRAITYESNNFPYPDKIKELEQKSSYNCDVCIQHTLPHNYYYNSSYRNIGYCAVESTSFKDTGWQHNINLMDEVWVPSVNARAACRLSGVTKPIHVVPHSLDIDQYVLHKQKNKISELEGRYNFIFVGEFIERKNIQALVRAFHMEFDIDEPVNLFIKTSKQTAESINKYIDSIKSGLKLRKTYKKEIVISGKLNFDDYLSVFQQCHSFVMPSRAEGFCIPALEAMCLGIPVIYSDHTGLCDFAYGACVQSNMVPCFGAVDTVPYLDNSNSQWAEINISELAIAMRNAYMKWNTKAALEDSEAAINMAKQYSHSVIGGKIKDILYDS